jgi:hypothetical protein
MSAQSDAALEKANRIRLARADVKRDLFARRITFTEALEHECCQTMMVFSLVSAQYRWGRSRTLKLLNAVGVSMRQGLERGAAWRRLVEEGNPDVEDQRLPFFDGFDAGYAAVLAVAREEPTGGVDDREWVLTATVVHGHGPKNETFPLVFDGPLISEGERVTVVPKYRLVARGDTDVREWTLEFGETVRVVAGPIVTPDAHIRVVEAAREEPPGEIDDAVHIAVDHGRRTLCGNDAGPRNTVGPSDARPDGMAGCWMCLLIAGELARGDTDWKAWEREAAEVARLQTELAQCKREFERLKMRVARRTAERDIEHTGAEKAEKRVAELEVAAREDTERPEGGQPREIVRALKSLIQAIHPDELRRDPVLRARVETACELVRDTEQEPKP